MRKPGSDFRTHNGHPADIMSRHDSDGHFGWAIVECFQPLVKNPNESGARNPDFSHAPLPATEPSTQLRPSRLADLQTSAKGSSAALFPDPPIASFADPPRTRFVTRCPGQSRTSYSTTSPRVWATCEVTAETVCLSFAAIRTVTITLRSTLTAFPTT